MLREEQVSQLFQNNWDDCCTLVNPSPSLALFSVLGIHQSIE